MGIKLLMVVLCLLFGGILRSETTNCVRYVTITQDVSRVFGNAFDRRVDRMRLEKTAKHMFFHIGQDVVSTNIISGLRVEKLIYLPSNKVEAVFSCLIASPL